MPQQCDDNYNPDKDTSPSGSVYNNENYLKIKTKNDFLVL